MKKILISLGLAVLILGGGAFTASAQVGYGGGGRHLVGSGSGGPINSSSQGQVLGVSTTSQPGQPVLAPTAPLCELNVSSYLRKGAANNVEQVKNLQVFLNAEMGSNLPVTGFFGNLTEAAVKSFQLKYYDEILKPWVDLGELAPNTPTGIVFKTTLWKIQKLGCPNFNLPRPNIP